MFVVSDITERDGWCIGDDLVLEFEVLQDDGAAVSASTPVEDVSGWSIAWALKKTDAAADPALIAKDTTSGITITGTYNASRAVNAQRVKVTIASATDYVLVTKALTYRHALKRMTTGAERVLTRGDAVLLKATTPL